MNIKSRTFGSRIFDVGERGDMGHIHARGSRGLSRLIVGVATVGLATALLLAPGTSPAAARALLPSPTDSTALRQAVDPTGDESSRPVQPPGFGTDAGQIPGLPPEVNPIQPSGVVRSTEDIGLPTGNALDSSERSENVARPTARAVVPGEDGLGLTRDAPIPLGWTCSCTIDRVGILSQFDITVLQVVRNAYPMIQQLNRFNPPPRPQHTHVAVYVGQNYVAGPQNAAYTVAEADFKATATDRVLEDTLPLLHIPSQYRLQYDVYPGSYVNGWLFYELPVNRPAQLAWRYSFTGERAIWFALQ